MRENFEREVALSTLQKISDGMTVILKRMGREKRTLATFRMLLTKNEGKIARRLDEWLDFMIREVQKGLGKIKGRSPKLITERLADWEDLKEQGERILKPGFLDVLAEGGKAVVERRILKQERFDPIGVAAVKWATKNSAALVREVADETMKAIRKYIITGIDKGKTIQAIAKELRPLVGLTERQMMAVANYHEWLIVNKPEYTVARIKGMSNVYARRMHRKRADLIARTETKDALWEGSFQGYDQMGIKKLEGVSSPDSCEWCLENIHGQVYPVDGARAVAADSHPGCECTWVAA
ncbi:MAG: hypothetical protein HWN68_06535 [Desulfobacterales bacterium]|nr:hypothetical protein [Desulfobacterales bacterium]